MAIRMRVFCEKFGDGSQLESGVNFAGLSSCESMVTHDITFRRINSELDRDFAFENYRGACIASYGSCDLCLPKTKYQAWLAQRIEEFPDGHLLAFVGNRFVGQLELQVPYGLQTGYINLFFVAGPWRRLGFGRQLHLFADRYFRSWEATEAQLHVSQTNHPALNFYRSLGYTTIDRENDNGRTWKMSRRIPLGE